MFQTVNELNDGRIIAFHGVGYIDFSDVPSLELLLFETDAGTAQIGLGRDASQVLFNRRVAVVRGQKRAVIKIVVFLPFSSEIRANRVATFDVALQQAGLPLQTVA